MLAAKMILNEVIFKKNIKYSIIIVYPHGKDLPLILLRLGVGQLCVVGGSLSQ